MRKGGIWLIRLAVVAALAWYMRPLYSPPTPPQPAKLAATDSVTWLYYQAGHTNVFQQLTVTGDGQSTLVITRKQGDPDLPETLTGLKLHLDRQAGIIEFREENVFPADRAKALFAAALREGVFGLQPVPTMGDERLRIVTRFEGKEQSVSGPVDLSSTFDWQQSVWLNRLRWQQVSRLPRNYPSLYKRLQKQEIILTDDHGKPVDSPPQ